jgi:nitroreductase
MQYLDLVQARQSIRVFAGTAVEEHKLSSIFEAANRAPSAGNLQSYSIYVVRDEEKRRRLSKCSLDQQSLVQAPVTLVFCTDAVRGGGYGKRGVQLYSVQDAAIACTFAMLAVQDVGLGTVWVGAFDPDAVREIVGAPGTETPVAMLPVGYGAEKPVRTPRRALEELVHEV